MSGAIVAKRYAEALFQLGEEKDILEKLIEELQTVKEVFINNKQFVTFLEYPRINDQKKKEIVDETFQGLHVDVLHTIKLLVERHRIGLIPSIIDTFIQLVHDAQGIAEVTVQSVRELSDEETDELKDILAKRFHKNQIKLKCVVNPDVLGGLHIQIGNTIIDGTISGKLNRIERNITSANK